MKKTYFLIGLNLFALSIYSQNIEIDLSKQPGQIITQTISPLTIEKITLKNRLISSQIKYNISIEVEDEVIPPFSSSDFSLPQVEQVNGVTESANCSKLQQANDSLEKNKDESKIPSLIKSIEDEIQNLKKPCSIERGRAIFLKASTTDEIGLSEKVVIKSGQMVTITVSRDKLEWKFVFKTNQKNHWIINYGFSYTTNIMNPTTTYFAKHDSASVYTITKSNSKTNNILSSVTPTILFTWKPGNPTCCIGKILSNEFYKIGFTFGLSVDLKNPTILVAPSIIVGENITLNFGLTLAQKDVLKGQYKESDQINENLTFDQLHEKVLKPEFIFSLGIRLDKSPFNKTSTTDSGK